MCVFRSVVVDKSDSSSNAFVAANTAVSFPDSGATACHRPHQTFDHVGE